MSSWEEFAVMVVNTSGAVVEVMVEQNMEMVSGETTVNN